MAKKYTNEQLERAKAVNLVDYLSRRGEEIKRSGGEYKWIYRDGSGTHDSVTIKNGGTKWFDHKNQVGGDSIGFLQEYMGLDFREAVEELLCGEQAEETIDYASNRTEYTSPPSIKKDFSLPKAADNMKKLFAYLIKTRFIDADIVQHFVKAKTMYQEKEHGNIVFLGLDENGTPRSGQKKSVNTFKSSFKATLTGSATEYAFGHKGTGNKLFVFEAPVDLMSYLAIYKDNWQQHSYISLDGLSSRAMLHFLESHAHITEVNICVDHDEAGIETYDKFRDLLLEKGYQTVNRICPPVKDWNECLKAEHGIKPIPAQEHPKIESYKDNADRLCSFYSQSAQKYGSWFAKEYAENGLHGVVRLLDREYQQFCNAIEPGKVTRIKSGNIHEHLLRMANICLMTMTELKCAGQSCEANRASVYKSTVLALQNSYKPYTDKGRLKNHCTDLDQIFESLKKILLGSQGKETVSDTLKSFANHCLCTKVYIDTKYEQDLSQQEAIFNRLPPKEEVEVPKESESMVMQMV